MAFNVFKKTDRIHKGTRPHTFNPFSSKTNPPDQCGFIPSKCFIYDNRTKMLIANNEEERVYDLYSLKKVFFPPNTLEYVKKQKQNPSMYRSTLYPISLLFEYRGNKQRVD